MCIAALRRCMTTMTCDPQADDRELGREHLRRPAFLYLCDQGKIDGPSLSKRKTKDAQYQTSWLAPYQFIQKHKPGVQLRCIGLGGSASAAAHGLDQSDSGQPLGGGQINDLAKHVMNLDINRQSGRNYDGSVVFWAPLKFKIRKQEAGMIPFVTAMPMLRVSLMNGGNWRLRSSYSQRGSACAHLKITHVLKCAFWAYRIRCCLRCARMVEHN